MPNTRALNNDPPNAGRFRSIGAVIALGILFMSNAGVAMSSPGEVSTLKASLSTIVKRIAPAVVSIETSERVAAVAGNSRQRKYDSARQSISATGREPGAAGSGVVFDAGRGLILTNQHVVNRGDEILVKLADGRMLPARRVGTDVNTDLAVIKVEAAGLTEVSFGDSDAVEVGDFVLAIGNPLQLGQTVTSGIVSGLHRANVGIIPYEDFIQTDAAIYPGNSGGALVDVYGRLVGINTAYIGAGKGNPGLGFAIPANLARSLARRMSEQGDILRGTVGVVFDDVSSLSVDRFAATPRSGAVILEVDRGSVAMRVGLQPGDLVTQLSGVPVRDASDLKMRIGLLERGDVAEFWVSRRGNRLIFRAAVAAPVK